jgi:biotin carboxyl carrier protein
MSEIRRLEVLVEAETASGEEGGGLVVRCPGVGVYGSAPRVGEILSGGSPAGRLTTLGETVELALPRGHVGRVAEQALPNRRDPVEYGQVLLRLVPVEAGEGGVVNSAAAAAADGLPEGCFAVSSPTRGMFYRRPSPDAPPYVDPGQVVDEGTTLGLVEVMKCFSAIAYGGDEQPARAEVVEIRPEDGAEVEVDQVLFVLRPA